MRKMLWTYTKVSDAFDLFNLLASYLRLYREGMEIKIKVKEDKSFMVSVGIAEDKVT